MTVTRATTATTARFRTRIIAVPVTGGEAWPVMLGDVNVSCVGGYVSVTVDGGAFGELVGSAEVIVGRGVSVASGVGVATGVAEVPNPATPL